MWRLVAVFLLCGYTISSVLAYDVKYTQSNNAQQTTDSQSLHTQIESDVALWVKKVWNNLVDFMQDWLPSREDKQPERISYQELNSNTLNQPIIRTNYSESESTLLPAFEDIQKDPQKQNIELFASLGLIHWDGQGKFHPTDHVRCSDFVRLIIDIYRYQLGYSIEWSDWLTNKKLLDLKQPNTLLWKKLNTAKELWILEWVDFIVRDQAITPLQVKKIIKNTLALHLNFGQWDKIDMIDTSKNVMTKSEMVKYLAEIFKLKFQQNDDVFSDISNHKYRSAITILAQLGVVAGRNGKFYPDIEINRANGIIMIADVTYFATYRPHLEYLLEHEIWNSLLHATQSGYVIVPDAVLTKWEAYNLVADAAGIKILNVDSWMATEPITRGELANLLVEAFEFSTPKEWVNVVETQTPKTVNNDNTSDEKKSLLVAILKDVINDL